MRLGEELRQSYERNAPPVDTREEIEAKWKMTFEDMDKWDISVDRKQNPECIVGTDDAGRRIEVSYQSAIVDGAELPEEKAQELYSKVFRICSAKADRWKMENKRDEK